MKNTDEYYAEALRYLYSFVDFSLQKAITYSPERFKLERMQALVEALGNPQNAYPIIHVAGTKGKGSVSVMCANVLHEAGYKVGLYTSPHLDDYAERIQINNEFIPHDDLVKMVEVIKPFVATIPELTTFEITTALAFIYFAMKKVNAAVIEVGLGGRLDATNVVQPVVSVITSISYDHTLLLGETLTEIAREKSGIIKEGIPVVASPQHEEASSVIDQIAKEKKSNLYQVGRDLLYEEVDHSIEKQTFNLWIPGEEKESKITLSIPLLGSHQVVNAATAYAALEIFQKKGYTISDQAVKQGFANVFWPGRFEIAQQNPPIILDCAHNRDSAMKLRLTLAEYFQGKKILLIFGASEDKDIKGMLEELMPVVNELILVKSFHPRAIEQEKIMVLVESYGKPVKIAEHIPEAIGSVLQQITDCTVVVVTGSIFVVAEARKFMEKIAGIRRY